MTGWLKHPLRVTSRLVWLGGGVVLGAWCFPFRCLFQPKIATLAVRARWLQQSCRRVLRMLCAGPRVYGNIPASGLLVCNHLSYLDVIVLASLTPAVFVSKREIKHWPVFGWFACRAGTIFVDREKRTHVGQLTHDIETVLNQGVLVILFAEGTSSSGHTVLPFKSSLLEPAVRTSHELSAGLIRYELQDGDVVEEVCYWRDMTLVPHLINLFGKRSLGVSVSFAPLRNRSHDRKELARQLHAEVVRLKASLPL